MKAAGCDIDRVGEIERVAMWAWPPVEMAACDGWLLRAGEGHTNRANSVQTLRFDGARLDAAIERVEGWYGSRGLPVCFKLCDHAEPAGLDEVLDARGHAVVTPSSVMIVDGFAGDPAGHGVELEPRATQAVMNVMGEGMSAAARAKRSRLFARIRRPLTFALVFEDGLPVATGMAVCDGEWGSIAGMQVVRKCRGRGLGMRVLGRLLGWLEAMGAARTFLQVEKDNEPAMRLYRRAGFDHAYDYHYRKLENGGTEGDKAKSGEFEGGGARNGEFEGGGARRGEFESGRGD